MEGIYEVRRWDGLRWYDMDTKFNKISLSIRKLIGGEGGIRMTQRHTDSIVTSYAYIYFFQNKDNMLQRGRYLAKHAYSSVFSSVAIKRRSY
jgi:hypothetical protein